MLTQPKIQALVEKTSGAYSFDRYANWESVIKALDKYGCDERQIEAIVCSKWTRWAGDIYGAPYGKTPAKAIIQYLDKHETQASIKALTKEHFGE